ncbi:hypothetical protein F9C11_17910 [Amycolatopsis sp. VS8301801F10]|uniref:hypothetical protein n=1 Tax=Amycolatopsis sp. VS8301801F10 TaxID=2652442 RepID=UPI0038FC6C0A
MVTDLETLVAQVWSPDVRPLAEEAWRCYNAGAIRSSIVATWAAVSTDIIVKLIWLADEGDRAAIQFREEVTAAQEKGLKTDGVRDMQRIEGSLLAKAVDFELIDTIGERELCRIQQDRHLCAHPSLRAAGEVYNPRPEVARGHLAVALTTLLVHPPTQGGKLLDDFQNYICDPLFAPSVLHIQATFHDRVRAATRKSLIKLAAKAAMLEIDPGGRMPADVHADRMAIVLDAFAERDRGTVRDAVAETREKLQRLDSAAQLRTLIRMADCDYFWTSVDAPLANLFEALLNVPLPADPWGPLAEQDLSSFALVSRSYARARLPILLSRFERLSEQHQQDIIATHPSEFFVPRVIAFLRSADSWRAGE